MDLNYIVFIGIVLMLVSLGTISEWKGNEMNKNEMKKLAYLEKIKDTMLAYYKAVSEPVPDQTAYQVALNLAKESLIQDIAHDAGLIIARDIYGELTLIPEDELDV